MKVSTESDLFSQKVTKLGASNRPKLRLVQKCEWLRRKSKRSLNQKEKLLLQVDKIKSSGGKSQLYFSSLHIY